MYQKRKHFISVTCIQTTIYLEDCGNEDNASQIHSVHCEQIQNQILKDFDMMASVDPGVQETPPARVLTLLV